MALIRIDAAAVDETLPTDEARWWPEQKTPLAVVKTTVFDDFEKVTGSDGQSNEGPLGATHMMVQSLAGLAAQAVNEDRFDEMVWIDTRNESYRRWYRSMLARLDLEERGTFGPWELLERYYEKGIVDGYVIYSYDYSQGGLYTLREGSDRSVNVATVAAGVMHGVLIEEGQEDRAREMGLELLFDARGKSESWCFEHFRDRLNPAGFLSAEPRVPHNRAIAIAHRLMAAFENDEPVPSIMAWMRPLSPVFGWGPEGEYTFTNLSSEYSHFQAATNWSLNITILSAGTANFTPANKFESVDPAAIDWNDRRPTVAFMMSDGDNVQWYMGNFCDSPSYWAAEEAASTAFTWTGCYSKLMQGCPDTVQYLIETQPDNVSMVEFGGSYHYPDRFAMKRPEKDLLAGHARHVNLYMERVGARVFGFLCHDLSSERAREAYGTYAREIEGLVGMVAIQYYPYEGGEGKVYWVTNREGIEIPVVTARYSLWAGLDLPRAGTPSKIARLINEDAAAAKANDQTFNAWTIVHAWSGFKQVDGGSEEDESAQFGAEGTAAGHAPTRWCMDKLDPGVHVAPMDELLWRIRMEHNPEQTRRAIENLNQ